MAFEQLRSIKGTIRLCLTRERRHFPDCKSDPAAFRQSGPARDASLDLKGIPPGAYALSIMHDENGNGRLDTFAGIPKEGFGFSRNPAIRFGPPNFAAVVFTVSGGHNRQAVRVRYLL